MFIECRHIMPTGRKCRVAALRGKPFCYYHVKLHFRKTVTRRPGKLTEPSIEGVPALKAAVAKALTALCSPLTDTRRAGLLLYAFISPPTSQSESLPGLQETQAKESDGDDSDAQCVTDTASNVRSLASEPCSARHCSNNRP